MDVNGKLLGWGVDNVAVVDSDRMIHATWAFFLEKVFFVGYSIV